ncbi:chemotaxis protein CheW [Paraburkholderia unamae]|uniref:Chemotaxis-related protein WspB n=1 Tax=Paraburkholderia unamae TaxID=219649 RepID=A0ABX5K8P3_9BURK|nr:chemotaxis protein CheW [Paraburkholderia unamae]PVX70930.1 chemotaxis-related protein WspB [Paraburkholderia unamae]CAG9249700.1 Chemotaxis signal transduction protein [Paraburkholderia unamae]
MLFLLFELDGERYALDAREIAHVLPLAPVRAFPGTPAYIAGVIDHEGAPVPVVDLSMLALGRPARALMSTRLVLVYDHDGTAGSPGSSEPPRSRRLALLLECATRTQSIAPERFAEGGIATPEARWLGPVARDESGFVQWVKVAQLLDARVRALLFPDPPTWQGAP